MSKIIKKRPKPYCGISKRKTQRMVISAAYSLLDVIDTEVCPIDEVRWNLYQYYQNKYMAKAYSKAVTSKYLSRKAS